MLRNKIRNILEVTTTVVVLVTAVAMLWLAYTGRLGARSPAGPKMYGVGDRLDVTDQIRFDGAPSALVIWVRSGCKFCTQSMEFYRDVIAADQRRSRVILMGNEPIEVLEQYASAHQLRPDQIVSAARRQVRLYATPIILLVETDGVIKALWRGMLQTEEQKQEVFVRLR